MDNLTNSLATQTAMKMKQEAQQLARQKEMFLSRSKVGRDFDKELKNAANGFEELFVHKMLSSMREATTKAGLLSGGRGEEVFQDMLDQEYAKEITRSKALGMSDVIYRQTKDSLK